MGRSGVVRLALALGLGQSGFHAYVASLPLAMVAAHRENGEIGAIMGSAALFSIIAALLSGGLIDRFGGRAVFLTGSASFAGAALLLATGAASPGGPTAALLLVRLLQGIGIAAAMPAVLSLVPPLVDAKRLPTSLAFVGVAANVSLAVIPPISLIVLERASLQALSAGVAITMVAAAAMIWPLRAAVRPAGRAPERDTDHLMVGSIGESAMTPTVSTRIRGMPRLLRPKWRAAWAAPLGITLLFLAHWGVITGYLPQRAAAAGADVGLFFTGDALALLALRIPGGYLAGRFGSLWLLLGGLLVTAASLLLLMVPPTTPLLIAAGIGTGAGGALILPTIMLELSHRSDASDRGSAFALFSVAFSIGIALGSIGVAPIIGQVGFEVALGAGLVGCLLGCAVAILDRSLRTSFAPAPAA